MDPNMSNQKTPLDFFYHWEKEAPDHPFLRQPVGGRWMAYSYKEAGIEIRKVAAWLTSLSLPPQSNVAIFSKNCAHWLMTDLAIMMAGHVSVPIYPTLTAPAIRHLLEHSESKVIFIGKLDQYEQQKPGMPAGLIQASFPHYGVPVENQWSEILEKFEATTGESRPAPDALATIMYSSGTTGFPKGVMLTHGAFGFVGERVWKYLKMDAHQRYFSYLPLSHIAERGLLEMSALASGSTISFAESLDTFAANLQQEEPTIFGGVPRIWAKFQEGVLAKLPQKKLDVLLRIPLVNTVIKHSIRKKLGMRKAKIMVSGAAPIPVNLIHWYKRLGMELGEMFGLTENTAYSHANYDGIKIGTVGKLWPDAEMKLSEEGEILIKHKALMLGYYKDPETTASTFTSDGFLRTGDKGVVDSDGFLTVTGRIKDQFKTDKGKFIAPAPIELALLANTDIEQVCVVGMGIPQPIALVVPSAQGQTKDRRVFEVSVAETLRAVNKRLESYEKLQALVVMKTGWTIENGLLTPSMKVKRSEVERIHLQHYPRWYAENTPVVWE